MNLIAIILRTNVLLSAEQNYAHVDLATTKEL